MSLPELSPEEIEEFLVELRETQDEDVPLTIQTLEMMLEMAVAERKRRGL